MLTVKKNNESIIYEGEWANGKLNGNYEPLQMQVSLIYIVFILTMIITLAGFIIYMVKSIFVHS